MPVITVQNAGELSTEVVVEITGKPANYVYTKIEEVARENFAIGGKPLG